MGCEEAPARDDASPEKMKKKDVFGMDVNPYFPVTFYCNSLLQHVRSGRSWRDVMELSCTIETAYIFTQGRCQVSTWFKIVPAVITLH
jgi:hypothetical protein